MGDVMPGVLWAKTDPDALAPFQAYPGDAGFDLHALDDVEVPPGVAVDVPTGLAVAIPEGFYGRICARSSAFRRRGLFVLEGVIDSGYRGELFVTAYQPLIGKKALSRWAGRESTYVPARQPVLVARGDAIGQLIVTPVPALPWSEVPTLPPSERGENGFGSSGR